MPENPLRLVKDDDIDPELVNLRRSRRVGPVLAASVLGLSIVLIIRLLGDFSYSLEPSTARADVPLSDNIHVAVKGALSLAAPGRMKAGTLDTGFRLTPLVGTAGKVWVHQLGEAIDVPTSYEAAFTGRLRGLSSVAFANDLRTFVEALPPQPRYVAAAGDTKDVYGDPLELTPETPVTVEERLAAVSLVTQVQTDEIKDPDAAARALTAAGITASLVDTSFGAWVFETPLPEAEAQAKLRAAKMFGANAAAKTAVHQGKVRELRATPDGLTLQGATVPRANIARIFYLVRPVLPDDAMVLFEGDSPAAYWYIKPLVGVLVAIGLLMAWALVLGIRDRRTAPTRPRLVDP